MQVDAAQGRHFQHLGGQDAPVSHYHDQLGGQGADVRLHRLVPQGAGLVDGDALALSQHLHRGRGEHLLAAHRLILPGEHAADLVPRLQNGRKAGRRDVRRAHEKNAH